MQKFVRKQWLDIRKGMSKMEIWAPKLAFSRFALALLHGFWKARYNRLCDFRTTIDSGLSA